MPFILSDNDGSLEVTPQRLHDTAPSFYKASNDTSNLVLSLNKITQQLVNEMSSELGKSSSALQSLNDRWGTAMNSLSSALEKVGLSLDEAAGNYQRTDTQASNSFQPHTYEGFPR